MSRRGSIFLLALLSAAPLFACPVCSGPVPRKTLDTYLGITAGLSILPVILLVSAWLGFRYFRSRKRDDGNALPF